MTAGLPAGRRSLTALAIGTVMLAACSTTTTGDTTADAQTSAPATTVADAMTATTALAGAGTSDDSPGTDGCGDAMREVVRREIRGEFDWGEDDEDADLDASEFEVLVDTYEVEPVPFPSGIADPDGPRSTFPGQPDRPVLDQLPDGSLIQSLEVCWEVGLLSDADEQRIWDEVWAELEATGELADDDGDDEDR